jgi:hypothetical protein
MKTVYVTQVIVYEVPLEDIAHDDGSLDNLEIPQRPHYSDSVMFSRTTVGVPSWAKIFGADPTLWDNGNMVVEINVQEGPPKPDWGALARAMESE